MSAQTYACTMDPAAVPEACVHWRYDGRCSFAGDTCQHRRALLECKRCGALTVQADRICQPCALSFKYRGGMDGSKWTAPAELAEARRVDGQCRKAEGG